MTRTLRAFLTRTRAFPPLGVAVLCAALAPRAAAAEDAEIGLMGVEPSEIRVDAAPRPAADAEIPVSGPFRLVGADKGVRAYEATLPFRPRALFYERPPDGMELKRGSTVFRYAQSPEDADRPGTWYFTDSSLVLRVRPETPRPEAGAYTMNYPSAQEREDALSPPKEESEKLAFVLRSAQVDDVTREGAYLPAPSAITWTVPIPAGGMLDFRAGVLPPEIDDGTRSDGADLDVEIDGVSVDRLRVAGSQFSSNRLDLSAWAGRTVRLSFRTSDADTTRDQVFVAAPTVAVPSHEPRRVLMLFVDTLRRDHLGTYGYARGASPHIDEFAKDAVVFEDTRSVAPWTLPSTRAILSGLQPEFWEGASTIQQKLGAKGWATGAFVGNVYLSSNFDMSADWGEHGCVNWPSAEFETERGLRFLRENADRDAFLMVHYMDMHLPYKEPSRYRHLYEKAAPAGLVEGFTRGVLLTAARSDHDGVRNYILARYDQNLRYVDDQVQRLIDAAGPNALVVFFSDHGEEFFDHGDLEHGHSLYDELIRVPLMIRAPGLAARQVDAPTSLLDLTPTLLDLLGMADPTLTGRSLADLARGGDASAFAGRAISFGRPLYGDNAWGSLRGIEKYISRSGAEKVFNLKDDAREEHDLRALNGAPRAAREALAEGLGQPVRVVYRLQPKGNGGGNITVVMHVPGGATAWVGDDPTNATEASVEVLGPETIRARFHGMRGGAREVFVAPDEDAEAIAGTVSIDAPRGSSEVLQARPYDGTGEPLATVREGRQSLEVNYAVMPLPAGTATSGYDPELKGALEKMGYLTPDRESAPATPDRATTPADSDAPEEEGTLDERDRRRKKK